MDISLLKEEFYQCIAEALKKFSDSEENKNVYAIVLDCDSSVGMVSLRCRNRQQFENNLKRYEEYRQEYGWAVYGLHGSEYDPGEFAFIDYQKSALVSHFADSYYYHAVGDYFGKGEPIEDIKDNYEEIFWEMIVDTINKLKGEMETLGIHTTDKFIMFHCDHDQSFEDKDKMISMTVDSEMMNLIG